MSANRWLGQTVICIGSGPSLTPEDCAVAKASGHRIITVNSSWRALPECDVIYASDHQWWRRYAGELTGTAERWTNNRKAAQDFKCSHYPAASGLNSGLAAIYLAHWFGAERIVLIGYDCQPEGARLHWHENHARLTNPNTISFLIWQKQFRQTRNDVRAKVVNCSRQTAIKVFRRWTLEQALQAASLDNQALLLNA